MEEAGLIGYRRLACAVLLRALFDAAHGNGHSADAWQWLGSDQAADLVRLLEMDPAGLARAWGELPRPVAVQLALPLW